MKKQTSYSAPESAKEVRLTVTPKSETWSDGVAVTQTYNYANNPPEVPPAPTFEIDIANILTASITNIQETINADSIEFAIYQDDTIKYKTVKATINMDARFVSVTTPVEAGHSYKIRCRSLRGDVVGGWTDFSSIDYSLPIAPTEITTLRSQTISEQQSTQYGVFVEWVESFTAKTYMVEWANNVELLGTINSNKLTTEEGQGPRLLIMGIDLGYEYFSESDQ